MQLAYSQNNYQMSSKPYKHIFQALSIFQLSTLCVGPNLRQEILSQSKCYPFSNGFKSFETCLSEIMFTLIRCSFQVLGRQQFANQATGTALIVVVTLPGVFAAPELCHHYVVIINQSHHQSWRKCRSHVLVKATTKITSLFIIICWH